jgi:hypothetical protein
LSPYQSDITSRIGHHCPAFDPQSTIPPRLVWLDVQNGHRASHQPPRANSVPPTNPTPRRVGAGHPSTCPYFRTPIQTGIDLVLVFYFFFLLTYRGARAWRPRSPRGSLGKETGVSTKGDRWGGGFRAPTNCAVGVVGGIDGVGWLGLTSWGSCVILGETLIGACW